MKAAPRNIQSLCKKTSVHFLILGTLFAGVLLVYIVTNAKTKDCIAEKLDSDYRARHQEAVDRAAEREYSMRLSPQEHNAKADEGSKLPSVAGLDSSRGPYSPAAVNHAESDTTKMAGSESSLGGRAKKGNVIIVGSSRRASSLAAVHDEIIGSTRLTGAGLEQPKELPLVEFCASDEKKKRFFTKENKRVTVSELAKSVVNSVEKYVFFVGYPRSGHSIIGSLLDSHPNMVISNEFGMFRKLIEEPNYQQVNRSFLYNALYRSSVCSYYFGLRAEEATKKGYTLRVDDAWQARYNGTIAVIGEKSGGNTGMTYRKYGHDKFLETFQRLLSTVKVPIFTIHAVRNPYDNIATMGKEFLSTESSLTSASHIFSSPEALAHTKWREALENPLVFSRVCAVVVDEAHCVSKWSKDFRPSYGRLAEFCAFVPACTPLMACTATASRSVKEEIIDSLESSRMCPSS